MAVKVAAGKINAVTGESWENELSGESQDYVVIPDQPWLDGFSVMKGMIRQFVAMPLGEGYTAEEQLTGEAEHGGTSDCGLSDESLAVTSRLCEEEAGYAHCVFPATRRLGAPPREMGLAPGGLMRQEIYEDEYGLEAWDDVGALTLFRAYSQQRAVL